MEYMTMKKKNLDKGGVWYQAVHRGSHGRFASPPEEWPTEEQTISMLTGTLAITFVMFLIMSYLLWQRL